ncbi:MAG: V-type ATPase 116kDa subunit family protein [Nitrososphaerota archaeon]
MGLAPLAEVSIIAPRHRLENLLKGLYSFGDFHAKAEEERDPSLHQLEHRAELGAVNAQVLIQELKVKDQIGIMDQLFGKNLPQQKVFTAEDVRSLLDELDGNLNPLKKRVDELLQKRKEIEEQITELSGVREALSMLAETDIDVSVLQGLKRFYVLLAVVSSSEIGEIKRSVSEGAVLEKPLKGGYTLILVAARREAGETLDRVLKSLGVKPLSIPAGLPQIPSQAYAAVSGKIERLRAEISEIEKTLEETARNHGSLLVALRDGYEIVRQALQRLGGGGLKHFAVVKGYIPAEKRDEFLGKLSNSYPVFIRDVDGHSEHDSRPSLTRNRGLLAAFEKITFIQGVPKTGELDPTPYVALFFSVFYGIMFADMGQGLVILGFALFMLRKVMGELRKWAVILAVLGISSSITGFLIGEAFGFKISGTLPSPALIHLVEEHGGAKTFAISEVQRLLIFTIFLGVLHLVIGYTLSIVKLVRERELGEALFVKLPTLAMYIFGILFGLAFFGAGGEMASILSSTSPAPLINLPTNQVGAIGVYGSVACIVVLMVGRLVAGYTGLGHRVSVISSVGQGLLEVLENIIHFLSNTISYARLTILLIVHSALMILLNSAWEALGPVSLPLLIIGNIGIILLEGMMVFIQSMRLHIYEFFSKFYEGVGEPFRRLAYETPYTRIRLEG